MSSECAAAGAAAALTNGCSISGYSSAPSPLRGLLWKQIPTWVGFGLHQQRYVCLEVGRLDYSKPAPGGRPGEYRGTIDFVANRCEVQEVDGTKTKFVVRPQAEEWLWGNFTGAQDGRLFVFDASDSEHSRDVWVDAIREHICYGDRKSAALSMTRRSQRQQQRVSLPTAGGSELNAASTRSLDPAELADNVGLLEEQRMPLPMKVVIISASDLRNEDDGILSDPYCVCEVRGRSDSRFETRTKRNTLDPVWNHEAEVAIYESGDTLLFTVWDRDHAGDDDFLGQVALSGSEFQRSGFVGELQLFGGGKAHRVKSTSARLKVKVVPAMAAAATAAAARAARGFAPVDTPALSASTPATSSQPPLVRISSASGRGIKASYCVCEILGKRHTRFQTKVIDSTPHIETHMICQWDHEVQIQDFSADDSFIFTVWNRDSAGNEDEFLGQIKLDNASFCRSGFDGNLQLWGCGDIGEVTLCVKVFIVDSAGDCKCLRQTAYGFDAQAVDAADTAAQLASSCSKPERASVHQGQTAAPRNEDRVGTTNDGALNTKPGSDTVREAYAALEVVIMSAKGLRNADGLPGHGLSNPYCVCEIPAKPTSQLRTKTVFNTLDPVWDDQCVIADYSLGDSLMFTIWSEDLGTQDHYLGRVRVANTLFQLSGFEGELLVAEAGEGVHAMLNIKIAVHVPSLTTSPRHSACAGTTSRLMPAVGHKSQVAQTRLSIAESEASFYSIFAHREYLGRARDSMISVLDEVPRESFAAPASGSSASSLCLQPRQSDPSPSAVAAQQAGARRQRRPAERWRCPAETEEVGMRSTIRVTIVGARGLPNAKRRVPGHDLSDPCCACELVGRPSSRFETRAVEDTMHPVWDHEATIANCVPHDVLLFTVLAKSQQSGVQHSVVLGKAELQGAQFLTASSDGFEGELPLSECGPGRGRGATLCVKVTVLLQTSAPAAAEVSSFDREEDASSSNTLVRSFADLAKSWLGV